MPQDRLADVTLGWHPRRHGTHPHAVALVLHGLNVNPQRMLPLVHELNGWGIEALTCSLMGHGSNYAPIAGLNADEARLAAFGRVTHTLWREEAAAAGRIAAARAAAAGVPLFLLGFSLGGVLGCAAALVPTPGTAPLSFARMALFAPALRVHLRSKILKLLAPWPHLIIPSATPAAYRADRGTTIAAYNSLYAVQDECDRLLGEQLNIPTLVLIDPQDEMVSAAGLERLISERALTRWRLHHVHKGTDAATRYHHLLIDAPSVGVASWGRMMAQMQRHFTAGA